MSQSSMVSLEAFGRKINLQIIDRPFTRGNADFPYDSPIKHVFRTSAELATVGLMGFAYGAYGVRAGLICAGIVGIPGAVLATRDIAVNLELAVKRIKATRKSEENQTSTLTSENK